MEFLVFLVLVGVFVLFYSKSSVVKALQKIQVVEPIVKRINPIQSAEWDALFESPRGFLTSMGFSQAGFVKIIKAKKLLAIHSLCEIWYDEKTKTFALLQLSQNPQPHWPWNVLFVNLMPWGDLVATDTEWGSEVFPQSKFVKLNHYRGDSWKSFYESHRNFLNGFEKNEKAIDANLDAFIHVYRSVVLDSFWQIQKLGLQKREDGSFQFTKGFAKKLVNPLLKLSVAQNKVIGQSVKAKGVQKIPPKVLFASIENQLQRSQEKEAGKGWSRLVVFLGSLVAFAFAFGWAEDPYFFVALIAVLIVHEAGHALAMKAFGYKDLSIFFIPFFGAAASGKKMQSTKAWQECVILLAGPVPGLLLALVAFFIWGVALWEMEFMSQLAILSLVLNGLNLLPFAPMDGGRLVDLLFFRRFPKLGIAFMVFSAIGLAGLSIAFETQVLFVVAVFILLNLKRELGQRKLLLQYSGQVQAGVSAEQAKVNLVDGIPAEFDFTKKVQMYRELKERFYVDPPSWVTVVLWGGVYLTFFVAPLVIAASGMALLGNVALQTQIAKEEIGPELLKRYKETCESPKVAQMHLMRWEDTLRIQILTVRKGDSSVVQGEWGDSVKVHFNGPLWFTGTLDEKRAALLPIEHFENADSLDESYWEEYNQTLHTLETAEDSIWDTWSDDQQDQWVLKHRPEYKSFRKGCLDLRGELNF